MLFAVVCRGAKFVLIQWRPLHSVEIPYARNHLRQNLVNALLLVLCDGEVTAAGVFFCLHETTRLQLDEFSCNLISAYFFENLSGKLKFHYNLTRKTSSFSSS